MALDSSGELLSMSLQNCSPCRLTPLPVLVMALVSAKAKFHLHGQPASDYQPTHTSHSLKKYRPASHRLFSGKQYRPLYFIPVYP